MHRPAFHPVPHVTLHRTHRPVRPLAVVGGLTAALLLSACGGTTPPADAPSSAGTAPATGGDRIAVVASTDVWGSVAQAVGGDAVEVTSIINDPSQDPHSFEASTRDQLLVQDAQVVVMNGGGYDPFMTQLLSATGTTAPVVDAVEVSGLEGAEDASADDHAGDHAETHTDEHADDHGHAHGEFNEHVWYDLATAGKVAQALAQQLSTVDPAQASTFTANAKTFTDGLAAVQQVEASVKASSAGTGVAITEPVPDYMLAAMGLEVKTPEAFSEAVEEGTDVSPAVLADTEALFSSGAVKALVYNEQTTGAETEAVLSAAKAAGTAVVPVTETLPDGQDYTQWMTANAEAIRAAVQG
ncbi:zinc/manganese transport system substrate-binding protein [Quadrisphaera granulorum]|uniref:Zinc/manganese transport system substrate-binding protein n=1 Tax=Quadrisphaera granulorum TaxID=317664 RepID=A0A316A5D5_9ACTN|nr:zinc ABC transporter substrate-binding protein [Quadrisphaera granulorum]PWJ52692.1 zinc/manganese transport system substrate-binding protein [Quadrisphaera granulorum]SZE97514.1 zinc/manganese transport system substrate-binding protein [Quadrisphaera granulorum]